MAVKVQLIIKSNPKKGYLRHWFSQNISTEKFSGMVFSPRIMTLHFSGFVFIKLSLNRSVIREHCHSIRNFASFRDSQHLYNLLSSAKLQRFPSSIPSKKAFIKMLNNSGPKTDPWAYL